MTYFLSSVLWVTSNPARTAVLGVLLAGMAVRPTAAQNNRLTERSFVPSPAVRAMGDAGVALVGQNRPFFYNPAQLPDISSYFTALGVQAGASRNLNDQIQFFTDRIQPAIESEFDLEASTLEQLYRDTYQLGERPIRGNGAVILPSFVYSTNGIGIGGGLFAKTAINYRVTDGGLGVPEIYLLSRTDVMAVGALGFDLDMVGLPGARVGVTATRTRRFLAFENKPLDTFRPDEAAILLQGNTVQVDVGGLYTPSWSLPGRLTVGGVVYDLLDERYDYAFGGAPRLPFVEGIVAGSASVDAGVAEEEVERARQRFQLRSSYRVGVAYRLPSVLFLRDVGLVLDYVGYGTGTQAPLARLHAGGRAEVGGNVILRTGLSGGYPTGGLGVRFGFVHLDYAVHAFEEGRVPGQLGTYVHTARLTVRID